MSKRLRKPKEVLPYWVISYQDRKFVYRKKRVKAFSSRSAIAKVKARLKGITVHNVEFDGYIPSKHARKR